MPHGGPGHSGGGENVRCRCDNCGFEYELEEGQVCSAVRCSRCGRYTGIGISQQKGGTVGPGRREDEEGEALIWLPPLPLPPLVGRKECHCPSCQYTMVVEAGTRCLLTDCPLCGHRMVEV